MSVDVPGIRVVEQGPGGLVPQGAAGFPASFIEVVVSSNVPPKLLVTALLVGNLPVRKLVQDVFPGSALFIE